MNIFLDLNLNQIIIIKLFKYNVIIIVMNNNNSLNLIYIRDDDKSK